MWSWRFRIQVSRCLFLEKKIVYCSNEVSGVLDQVGQSLEHFSKVKLVGVEGSEVSLLTGEWASQPRCTLITRATLSLIIISALYRTFPRPTAFHEMRHLAHHKHR